MNVPKQFKLKITWQDVVIIFLGSSLYAVALDFFFAPNSVTPGGVTGLSIIINHLSPALPIGILIIVLNIPIFVLGWRSEGHTFLIKSIIGTVSSSVMIDLLNGVYAYTEDHLLAALCGGVLMGAGLGLIFARGGTTGGSDIIARVLNNKLPNLSVGRFVLVVDAGIIAAAALVFGSINYALYSLVSVYVCSLVIDSIIFGADAARVAYIITERTELVVEAIARELDRGATLLQGTGTYSGQPRNVIMCAIKRRQIVQLKQLVQAIDPGSFVIFVDAHEVLGDGFKKHIKEKA